MKLYVWHPDPSTFLFNNILLFYCLYIQTFKYVQAFHNRRHNILYHNTLVARLDRLDIRALRRMEGGFGFSKLPRWQSGNRANNPIGSNVKATFLWSPPPAYPIPQSYMNCRGMLTSTKLETSQMQKPGIYRMDPDGNDHVDDHLCTCCKRTKERIDEH